MNAKCGHPCKKQNLINGQCGTCMSADEFEKSAKQLSNHKFNKKMKKALMDLSHAFRSGDIIFDKKGKPMVAWDKILKK